MPLTGPAPDSVRLYRIYRIYRRQRAPLQVYRMSADDRTRPCFEFVVTAGSLREVQARNRPQFTQWVYDVIDTWLIKSEGRIPRRQVQRSPIERETRLQVMRPTTYSSLLSPWAPLYY